MKIRPVGAELFYSLGQTDKHDEANSRFSQFCEKRLKFSDAKFRVTAFWFSLLAVRVYLIWSEKESAYFLTCVNIFSDIFPPVIL